ncbi:MAG: DUF167 domain-containing protein [Sinimarinibacterium sp.]|jgi:hypothetical protein
MRLQLKVTPKGGRNAINGWMGETLKLSVTAAPEKGKANQAVIELLADVLHLPKSAFTILRGDTSAQKLVEVRGLDEGEILRRLQHPGS